MRFKDKLFSFEGRLRRRDWWVLSILLGIASLTISEFVVRTFVNPDAGLFDGTTEGRLDQTAALVRMALSVPFWWPGLAMAVKRRHDRDKSAKVYLGAYAGSVALSLFQLFGPRMLDFDITWLWLGLSLVYLPIALWMLIVVAFLDGTPGPNRYGPSPKGEGGSVADTFT